jgi:transposase
VEVLYQHYCGLDVHKQTLTACAVWRDESTQRQQALGEFPTHTEGLRQLAKWLKERGVQQVAMESTGEYWRPVWNLLEAEGFSQTLANA